jgi:hypothetical protein
VQGAKTKAPPDLFFTITSATWAETGTAYASGIGLITASLFSIRVVEWNDAFNVSR